MPESKYAYDSYTQTTIYELNDSNAALILASLTYSHP